MDTKKKNPDDRTVALAYRHPGVPTPQRRWWIYLTNLINKYNSSINPTEEKFTTSVN